MNETLKRALSGAVYIIVLLGCILHSKESLAILFGMFLVIGIFEFSKLISINRYLSLLGNKKCVISEISQENYFTDAIIESPLQNITNAISFALKDDKWRNIALKGYNMFKENKCKKTTNFN
jgi:hypothetical protein